MGEQRVRGPADRRRAEQQVHDRQERPLEQERGEAGEHAGAFSLVQRGHLALQPLGLLAVPLAQGQQLRGQPGLGGLPAQGAQAQRHEQEPDRHGEGDDRGDGG